MRFGDWVLVPLQGAAARCIWPVCILELGCWCSCRVLLQGDAHKYPFLLGVYAGVIFGILCSINRNCDVDRAS